MEEPPKLPLLGCSHQMLERHMCTAARLLFSCRLGTGAAPSVGRPIDEVHRIVNGLEAHLIGSYMIGSTDKPFPHKFSLLLGCAFGQLYKLYLNRHDKASAYTSIPGQSLIDEVVSLFPDSKHLQTP